MNAGNRLSRIDEENVDKTTNKDKNADTFKSKERSTSKDPFRETRFEEADKAEEELHKSKKKKLEDNIGKSCIYLKLKFIQIEFKFSIKGAIFQA